MIKRSIFFILWTILSSSQAAAYIQAPLRYFGSFQNPNSQTQQLVKLDLIPNQSNGKLSYIAFLSFYFGDYSSQEYVTYHYDEAQFNLETSTLSLEQVDQAITFSTIFKDNEDLQGHILHSLEGDLGVLHLSKNPNSLIVSPSLMPGLANEYRGLCQGKATTLQIQTMRSLENTSRVGNPFGAYAVQAQWGEFVTKDGCFGVKAPCVKYKYDYASYNFFRGELKLFGSVHQQSCQVHPHELVCNDCTLAALPTTHAKVSNFPQTSAFWEAKDYDYPSPSLEPSESEGKYLGYLHHDYLNIYQNCSLQLSSLPKDENGRHALAFASTAGLYFGDSGSQESLHYKFKQAIYKPFGNSFILQNIEDDTDALLLIEEIKGDYIRGSWYSILFGRVGSFLVQKHSVLKLPEGLSVMGSLSGNYIGEKWQIELQVSRESTPNNTQNPFFPLNFRGVSSLKSIPDFNKIIGGSFDFYTGKIGIQIEDGSYFFGEKRDNRTLLLKRPTPGVLRPLLPQALVPHIKGE